MLRNSERQFLSNARRFPFIEVLIVVAVILIVASVVLLMGIHK